MDWRTLRGDELVDWLNRIQIWRRRSKRIYIAFQRVVDGIRDRLENTSWEEAAPGTESGLEKKLLSIPERVEAGIEKMMRPEPLERHAVQDDGFPDIRMAPDLFAGELREWPLSEDLENRTDIPEELMHEPPPWEERGPQLWEEPRRQVRLSRDEDVPGPLSYSSAERRFLNMLDRLDFDRMDDTELEYWLREIDRFEREYSRPLRYYRDRIRHRAVADSHDESGRPRWGPPLPDPRMTDAVRRRYMRRGG
jgi:hypothetical protein